MSCDCLNYATMLRSHVNKFNPLSQYRFVPCKKTQQTEVQVALAIGMYSKVKLATVSVVTVELLLVVILLSNMSKSY